MFAASGMGVVAPQTTQGIPFPAPSQGVNAADNLSEMSPKDAIYSYNLTPQQYGLKVRAGYRQFAVNVGTDGGRTVIPYYGSSTALDRLFVCAEDGIYDVSGGGDTFSPEITFVDQDAMSGYGQSVAFATAAGHFQVYCDETNGYYLFDEGSVTWSRVVGGAGPTEVDDVDPNDLVSCCNHKGRLWFVERGTAIAWYLSPGAVFGAATAFDFGSRFKKGGYLVNLYNWTVDGGEGMDDYLVAISSAGDVVIYRGVDPDDATTWFMRGIWEIGRPPAGRRVAGTFGGQLYLLSSYGILPAEKLISGVLVQEQSSYLSRRIAPLIHTRMQQVGDELGWEITNVPGEQILLVGVPEYIGYPTIQFAYSTNVQGWGFYRDFPYFTGNEWNGVFYFSQADGTVYIHEGFVDNVDIDDSSSYEPITFSVLTSFQALDPSEHFKRGQFIRPYFIGGGVPSYEAKLWYDYNLGEGNSILIPPTQPGALWDIGLWDTALWSGGDIVSAIPGGADGLGTTIAVGLRGETTFATTLIKFTVMMDAGGLL
jgi:hypothetical protein